MRRIILNALIEDEEGKFLITRQGEGARQSGLWGVPGGNLEEDETDLVKALKREVKEEVNLDIIVEGLIGVHLETVDSNLQLIFLYFKTKKVGGELSKSEEVDDFKWLTVEEIENFPKDLIRPPYSWFEQMLKAFKANKPIDITSF